ncbi:MAG: hypothetical protein QNK37_20465 [Acidobacteriota bacterium]|nr:hypothetical protein [Acidobacteriota bacterium]
MKKHILTYILTVSWFVNISIAQNNPTAMTSDNDGNLTAAYMHETGFHVKRSDLTGEAETLITLKTQNTLHLTALATNGQGVILVTGWFRGTLLWNGGQLEAGPGRHGFVVTLDQIGVLGEPRLLPENSGLPVSAGAAGNGLFQILLNQPGTREITRLLLEEDAVPFQDEETMPLFPAQYSRDQTDGRNEESHGLIMNSGTTVTVSANGQPCNHREAVDQPDDQMEDPDGVTGTSGSTTTGGSTSGTGNNGNPPPTPQVDQPGGNTGGTNNSGTPPPPVPVDQPDDQMEDPDGSP